MKDKEARDDIGNLNRFLWGDEKYTTKYRLPLVPTVDAIEEYVGTLTTRIKALEALSETVERDCPVCKHLTLMKREGEAVYKNGPMTTWSTGWFDSKTGKYEPHRFYCYGCGKTFREQEGLVEVE